MLVRGVVLYVRVRLADQVMQQIKEGRDTLTATYTGESGRHECEGVSEDALLLRGTTRRGGVH